MVVCEKCRGNAGHCDCSRGIIHRDVPKEQLEEALRMMNTHGSRSVSFPHLLGYSWDDMRVETITLNRQEIIERLAKMNGSL